MPQFSYRAFLWVFAISNAIVWFAILCGLALFLHAHFADEGHITRPLAVRVVSLGWLIPTVLSLQGAIVNLRAQFLEGRFSPPAEAVTAVGCVRNPWRAAISTAVVFWSVGLPVSWFGLGAVLPDELGPRATALAMAGIGAAFILVLIIGVADREFRSYLAATKVAPSERIPASTYVISHIALPWGAVNLLINAVLAWVMYAVPGGAPVAGLRVDLVVMAFLITVFMGLSALPEVETDVYRKLVELPRWLPSMPRLWMRYGYAAAVALMTYVIFTAGTAAVGASIIPLPLTIVIKAVSSGLIAAGAAGVCALWGLSRCAGRQADGPRLGPLAPLPAVKATRRCDEATQCNPNDAA